MFRNHLTKLSMGIALSLAASASGFADLYYTGTPAGNAPTGGSGVWDNLTTTNWSSTATTANSKWQGGLGNGNANFIGTSNGTVTTAGNISVVNQTYGSLAGVYNIVNNNTLTYTGAVTNGSVNTQTFTNGGLLVFNGSSLSGTFGITNTGETDFAGASTGGSSTTIANNGGIVDLSGLTSTGISAASLNNAGGFVTLGTGTGGVGKSLTLGSLTLGQNSEFDFTLGTTSSIMNANAITDSANPGNPITLDIEAGAGFTNGRYTLIEFTGGGAYDFTPSLSDYSLGLPSGFEGSYLAEGADGHSLDLVAVPEVSSFALPILGAAGLLWLRRRRSAANLGVIAEGIA